MLCQVSTNVCWKWVVCVFGVPQGDMGLPGQEGEEGQLGMRVSTPHTPLPRNPLPRTPLQGSHTQACVWPNTSRLYICSFWLWRQRTNLWLETGLKDWLNRVHSFQTLQIERFFFLSFFLSLSLSPLLSAETQGFFVTQLELTSLFFV